MKKHIVLLSALFMALVITSCQKDDGPKPMDGLYVCNVVNNKPSHMTTLSFKDGKAYEFRYYRTKNVNNYVSIPVSMKGKYPKYTLSCDDPSVKQFQFILGFLVHNMFSASFQLVFVDGDDVIYLPAQEWRYIHHDDNLDQDGDNKIDIYTY